MVADELKAIQNWQYIALSSLPIQNTDNHFRAIFLSSGVLLKYSFSKCFTILADETSDISSIEQFALCIRYIESTDVNNFKIVENFLKFVPVESTSGQNLADVLLTTLNSCGININYLRGQGYDGAAAMSGIFKGVQARIIE